MVEGKNNQISPDLTVDALNENRKNTHEISAEVINIIEDFDIVTKDQLDKIVGGKRLELAKESQKLVEYVNQLQQESFLIEGQADELDDFKERLKDIKDDVEDAVSKLKQEIEDTLKKQENIKPSKKLGDIAIAWESNIKNLVKEEDTKKIKLESWKKEKKVMQERLKQEKNKGKNPAKITKLRADIKKLGESIKNNKFKDEEVVKYEYFKKILKSRKADNDAKEAIKEVLDALKTGDLYKNLDPDGKKDKELEAFNSLLEDWKDKSVDTIDNSIDVDKEVKDLSDRIKGLYYKVESNLNVKGLDKSEVKKIERKINALKTDSKEDDILELFEEIAVLELVVQGLIDGFIGEKSVEKVKKNEEKKDVKQQVIEDRRQKYQEIKQEREDRPPKKKGWFSKKFSKLNSFFKKEKEVDSDNLEGETEKTDTEKLTDVASKTGYQTITTVLGIKTATDLALALEGKGDIYNYGKVRGGKKVIVKKMEEFELAKEKVKKGNKEKVESSEKMENIKEMMNIYQDIKDKMEELKKSGNLNEAQEKEFLQKLKFISLKQKESEGEGKEKLAFDVEQVVGAYVENKVSALKITKDLMNGIFVGSGLALIPGLRSVMYAGFSAAEFAQKIKQKQKNEMVLGSKVIASETDKDGKTTPKPEIGKLEIGEIETKYLRETYETALKTAKDMSFFWAKGDNKTQKAASTVKALGKIARVYGIYKFGDFAGGGGGLDKTEEIFNGFIKAIEDKNVISTVKDNLLENNAFSRGLNYLNSGDAVEINAEEINIGRGKIEEVFSGLNSEQKIALAEYWKIKGIEGTFKEGDPPIEKIREIIDNLGNNKWFGKEIEEAMRAKEVDVQPTDTAKFSQTDNQSNKEQIPVVAPTENIKMSYGDYENNNEEIKKTIDKLRELNSDLDEKGSIDLFEKRFKELSKVYKDLIGDDSKVDDQFKEDFINKIIKESGYDIDEAIDKMNQTIGHHEGISHAIMRQLEADSESFGYDKETDGDLYEWAKNKAGQIVKENKLYSDTTDVQIKDAYDSSVKVSMSDDGKIKLDMGDLDEDNRVEVPRNTPIVEESNVDEKDTSSLDSVQSEIRRLDSGMHQIDYQDPIQGKITYTYKSNGDLFTYYIEGAEQSHIIEEDTALPEGIKRNISDDISMKESAIEQVDEKDTSPPLVPLADQGIKGIKGLEGGKKEIRRISSEMKTQEEIVNKNIVNDTGKEVEDIQEKSKNDDSAKEIVTDSNNKLTFKRNSNGDIVEYVLEANTTGRTQVEIIKEYTGLEVNIVGLKLNTGSNVNDALLRGRINTLGLSDLAYDSLQNKNSDEGRYIIKDLKRNMRGLAKALGKTIGEVFTSEKLREVGLGDEIIDKK